MAAIFDSITLITPYLYVCACRAVQHKVGLAIKNVNKLGKLTAKLSDAFRHAKSVTEVEHLVCVS